MRKVPEVLPNDMINLAAPNTASLIECLVDAIEKKRYKNDSLIYHERIKSMYSWEHVAEETLSIYDEVKSLPRLTLIERLERYMTSGSISGLVGCLISVTVHFISLILNVLTPIESIDVVPDLVQYENRYSK